ncbi:MAG: divalent-cation tolerance protein CutA [Gammaproteobacteria bacterium]|nr:divalent-cation tolerance protein CutA [Gammaproteobacteria bacterium]
MTAGQTAILVLTTCPDSVSAERLAGDLVTRKLAACVTQLAGARSIYRWQGRLEKADEVVLLIKSTQICFDALAAAIKAGHPYELPEIIAVRVDNGLPEYLSWITENTHP